MDNLWHWEVISNIRVCVRACVCKRHLLVAAQYLNTLLILRNLKTNWCLGKSLFLLLGSGKLMLPSRTLNSVRMTQRHRIMQRHIRDYSSNLWPTETPNSSEWQEQQSPGHDKGSPVKTTSATASKAEFSYGKILTRLCLFGGSITFLSLVLQCPCRFCELYDMLPKKSFSASDTWFLLFKTKNLDWYNYHLVQLLSNYQPVMLLHFRNCYYVSR